MIYINHPEYKLLIKYEWFSKLKYEPRLGFGLTTAQFKEYITDYKYNIEYELKLMERNNVKYNQTLYSRNASGRILIWNIQVIDKVEYASIVISHGENGGNLITKIIKIEEGKNIGKSNETTPVTQAIAEAKSKFDYKLNQGYVLVEDISEIDTVVPMLKADIDGDLKPMLAQKFKYGTLTYPQLLQPKLDGVRCEARFIIKSDGLFGESIECQLKSRDGKIYNVQHIQEALLLFAKEIQNNSSIIPLDYDQLIFDGELYCHDMLLQEIVSAVKKPNKNTHKIQYWIYDIKSNDSQIARIKMLETYGNDAGVETLWNTSKSKYSEPPIVIVETIIVNSDEEAVTKSEEYILQDYEGGIVRNLYANYEYGKRSKYLRKIKKVEDREFLLLDIIESGNDTYEGKPIAMFVCQNDVNNKTFKVTPQATKQERYEYLLNKKDYIGELITVKYRGRTKELLPFHCNGIIRNYE